MLDVMTCTQHLTDLGGITRTQLLTDRGCTDHAIRRGVRTGVLVRPRRGWVGFASSPPELLRAARHGVIVTCLSQASHLGLWSVGTGEQHVAASHRGLRLSELPEVVHWHRPIVARAPGQLRDSVENTLQYVAVCQPHDTALAVWESALRKGLTNYSALSELPLRGIARKLLEECTPFADSGLETIFRTQLNWLPIPITPQVKLFGHRVDFLIGDRLVVQIDGGTHVGAQRTSDIRHDALLLEHGYRVLRFGYEQIRFRWPEVQRTVLQAIARGHHVAR